MSNHRPELEGNRFEAMFQNWRGKRKPRSWRRIVLRALAAFLVLEIVSLGIVFVWYGARGVQSAQFLDKFLLTRYTLSPILFDNPARNVPGIDYIGTKDALWASAHWHIADPILGWRLRPNTSMLKQPNEVWDLVGWRMTNKQGFAAAGSLEYFYEKPKPANVYRVIVTGGSTVEGDGAETPLDNLPSKLFYALDARLKSALPPGHDKLEVINAGVGAYGSAQEYLYLITDLLAYEPDLVISYGGAVDFRRAKQIYDQQGRLLTTFRVDKHREYQHRLNDSFEVLGSAIQFANSLVNQVRFFIDELAISYVFEKGYEKADELVRLLLGRERKIGEATVTDDPHDESYIDAAINTYHLGARLMASTAKEFGIPVLFVMPPMMASPDKPLAPGTETRMYKRMSKREIDARLTYFAKAGAMLDSLGKKFPDHKMTCFADLTGAFTGVSQRVYEDTSHLLGAGNTIMADKIVASLERCGMLPAAKP
ncbi:MAG: SGNH/GDSL hydrolase family protein [Alphaproteobacteria bacterium]|nr:SGNH/GDSL hydrolase family protein [Alphaproteobacteria bacterium]